LQGAESSETDIPRFKSANPDDSFRKNDESSPDLRRKRVTASYDGEFYRRYDPFTQFFQL